MGYKNEYDKNMEAYQQLVLEYETITNNEKYKEICDTMPFDFLNANQKVETLRLFHEVDEYSRFHFKRADDAIAFMNGFMDLRKGMDELLDGASMIVLAEEKALAINQLVEESPYLPSNLCLSVDNFIFEIARKCLKVLPTYPKLMNLAFKQAFVENCVEDLSIPGLQKLIAAKMIVAKDVEVIKASGSSEYKKKMDELRTIFGMEHLFYEKHELKLSGTSFKNEDGVNRQCLLNSLKNVENPTFTTEKGTFHKSPGVTLPSVAILWEGKTIGYLPQGTVDAMIEKYKNPEYEAKLKEITGGNEILYGCTIELNVIAKDLITTEEQENLESK